MQTTNNPVIIRPALKRACCGNDACRAAIYNQLLFSIAWKVKHGGEYWYGTGEDIYNAVDQSWGLSKVNNELKALVKDHLIFQRRNPNNGWDQTRQYLFREEEAQALKEMCDKAGVCIHQMGFCADVLHLLNLTNAFGKNNKCICSIHQIDSVNLTNPFVESNEAIPKDTTKVTSKDSPEDTNNVVLSGDENHATPAEIEKQITRLQAELKRSKNATSQPNTPEPPKGSARPTTVGQNDTPLTPAGKNTAAEGGNSLQSFFTPTEECICGVCQRVYKNKDILSSEGENAPCGHPKSMCFDVKNTSTDHTAIPEPVVSPTMPLTQESAIIPPSENAPSENALHSQEMPLSVPTHDETSNQATEQGKQASGDDPIANGTIENLEPDLYTEQPFKDRPVETKRNGRKINPVNERVKWFYDTFTALGVEFFGLETFKADYFYGKSNPTYQLVMTYISEGASPFDMRLAFEHMWNEEKNGKCFWQNPDTLTTRAFCNNFRAKLLGAKFKKKQEERKLRESAPSENSNSATTTTMDELVMTVRRLAGEI